MTDAEKKWEEWDNEVSIITGNFYRIPCPSKKTREAYKQALREAIEDRIKQIDEFYKDKDTSIGSTGHASMMAESLSHHSFIKLLNTVTPK